MSFNNWLNNAEGSGPRKTISLNNYCMICRGDINTQNLHGCCSKCGGKAHMQCLSGRPNVCPACGATYALTICPKVKNPILGVPQTGAEEGGGGKMAKRRKMRKTINRKPKMHRTKKRRNNRH